MLFCSGLELIAGADRWSVLKPAQARSLQQ